MINESFWNRKRLNSQLDSDQKIIKWGQKKDYFLIKDSAMDEALINTPNMKWHFIKIEVLTVCLYVPNATQKKA